MEPSAKPSMPRSATGGRGLDPTLERVRSKLGGGSHTTINRVLTAVLLPQRRTHATQISEVPADLVEIGQRAVAAIYAVQRQAAGKIELIETNSRNQIDPANHARGVALEIERLEGSTYPS
jgi:hypothetical protein